MSRKVGLGAVAVVGAAGAVAFVFLIVEIGRDGLSRAGAWAGPLGALAGIVAAVAAAWVLVPRKPEVLLPTEPKTTLIQEPEVVEPPEPEVPEWVVDRPDELAAVVSALVDGAAGMVGITTGLYGAGGFGKTVLARMTYADRRVWQWFGGRVHLVTVGRDVREPTAIAAKVNDVIKLVTGQDVAFTDPLLAGQHLGSVLDGGPRRLLVLDDVWEAGQLAPFTYGGKQCARLVTTRIPELLAGRGIAIKVDQMSLEQARALLRAGLPPLEEEVVLGLLAVTGRWPLLLRLVNRILADYVQVAAGEVDAQGAALVKQLRLGGPAVVDRVLGEDVRMLDVGQPEQRARAVRATIEASTGLLNGDDRERLAELGVFAEDEAIPFILVARLWQAMAGLDELQASQVVRRLGHLALVSQAAGRSGSVVLHDVIRDFLRAKLGRERLGWLHGVLVDAVVAGLPAADSLEGAVEGLASVAWWALRDQDRYIQDHLIEHLREAGRVNQAEAVACDLRWVGARLERFGPVGPARDLAAAGTPRAARLRVVLLSAAHLLTPTQPAGAVVDVLHSRVAEDPDWGPQVAALAEVCHRPRLIRRWPLPDLADPSLRRVLVGHVGRVAAVAVAPDGRWLATGGGDYTARIWDASTGQERTVLSGHTGPVVAVAVSPDGRWLATGSYDHTARIWDAATGQERTVLSGHTGPVEAVAVAPDGRSLATGSWDHTARIWDAATGQERTVLSGHTGPVVAVAVAPDGRSLATGSYDGTVRVWDAATGRERTVLSGRTSPVFAVAVAPDGRWVASGSGDRTVRIWDAATGRERAVLSGHVGPVEAVAVAPDGRWLVSGSWDGTVRIWDAATTQKRSVLKGHAAPVDAVAVAPDGRWLVSGSWDGTVRIWDAATTQKRFLLKGHAAPVDAVAVAPDGRWLVSGGGDAMVRIWDAATGQERAVLSGHTGPVFAVAVAPDGRWLVSGGGEGTVRIWDAATGQERAVLSGHDGPVSAVAVAPDGRWLVSGGGEGTLRIWDAATGQERAVLSGHHGSIFAVAVAPDGRWLVSGGGDAMVRIWDAATGRERAVLSGRTGIVHAVAVAPDGSWLAAGSYDGTVRIWDVATGRERAVLSGHTSRVHAVAVAPDGNWLASGSIDRTVRIWHAVTGHASAMMRIDNDITTCGWLGSDALVIGGSAGLYIFGFLT